MKNLSALFLAISIAFSISYAAPIEIRETPKDDMGGAHPEDFPTKGFSFSKCSERIPVKRGKNPWLKVVKKQNKSTAMNPAPNSWVESYFVKPANAEKRFSVINQEDSIYSSPTTLARIDCKHGLIYFQHLMREPIPTNTYRVLDLISGEEYQATEGAVTISPDGSYMFTASASDRDQKCGQAPSCDVNIKLYNCKQRKSQGSACTLQAEKKFTVSRHGKAAAYTPLPLKWKQNKYRKELKATFGGSSRSPAKIICTVLPKFDCGVAQKGSLEFFEK